MLIGSNDHSTSQGAGSPLARFYAVSRNTDTTQTIQVIEII